MSANFVDNLTPENLDDKKTFNCTRTIKTPDSEYNLFNLKR